jgi:hypothetical protein
VLASSGRKRVVFGQKKKTVFSSSAADALLDPHIFQVTTVCLAHFEKKNILVYFEKRHM